MKSVITLRKRKQTETCRTLFATRSMLVLLVLIASTTLFALPTAPQHETLFTLSFVDAPLKDVLAEIEKDSDFSFVCKRGVNLNGKVTFTTQNERIENVLPQALKDMNLLFEINENQIIIYPKEPRAFREPPVVKGTVTDSYGEPVVSAVIQVKGTGNGTVTDTKGEFELPVEGSVTLVITYAEIRPVEIAVHPRQKLVVVLPVQ